MRLRDTEAARLEADYLARIRAALAGRRDEGEIAEIVEGVREHLDEATAGGEGAVSLSQMARAIEELGPPEAYAEGEQKMEVSGQKTEVRSEKSEAGSQKAEAGTGVMTTAAAASANAVATVDYVRRPFEFGGIFMDAVTLWGQNFLIVFLAALISGLLTGLSLGVLGGPLEGGLCLMVLRAIQMPEHKVKLEDLFNMFGRFWPLVGLFFLTGIAGFLGMLACVVPGILLATIWGWSTYFAVDKGLGVMDSLKASYAMVTAPGRFGLNFLLMLVVLVINVVAASVPNVGGIVFCLVTPLTWFMCGLAYVRQVREAGAGAVGMVAVG